MKDRVGQVQVTICFSIHFLLLLLSLSFLCLNSDGMTMSVHLAAACIHIYI